MIPTPSEYVAPVVDLRPPLSCSLASVTRLFFTTSKRNAGCDGTESIRVFAKGGAMRAQLDPSPAAISAHLPPLEAAELIEPHHL